eukprot:217920-Pyramimonas_sp.AAC.1
MHRRQISGTPPKANPHAPGGGAPIGDRWAVWGVEASPLSRPSRRACPPTNRFWKDHNQVL